MFRRGERETGGGSYGVDYNEVRDLYEEAGRIFRYPGIVRIVSDSDWAADIVGDGRSPEDLSDIKTDEV